MLRNVGMARQLGQILTVSERILECNRRLEKLLEDILKRLEENDNYDPTEDLRQIHEQRKHE